jgi:predicted RNA-binding protein YlqC (UPF0109 family)
MLHMDIKELVQYIVQAIVDNPDEVSISAIEGGHATVLELSVAKSDLGKVIGKKGQNVQAIRTILNSVSGKVKKRVIIELIE